MHQLTRRRFVLSAAAFPLAFTTPICAQGSGPGRYPLVGGLVSGDTPAGGGPRDGAAPSSRIAPETEPGQPLILAGTVYARDGRTPAHGITVFAYHTDIHGLYGREGNPRRMPRLHGWARTGADGKYELRTIRPAPYPGRSNAAHIHIHISSKELPEWSVPSVLFEGDPLITSRERELSGELGRFAYIHPLTRDRSGALRCVHDIQL
jgi:protocatechuate 3,4-dioxygenase, beta subunit